MNQALTSALADSQHDSCGAEQGLISVDQALQFIFEHSNPLTAEILPLAQALNRYLSEDIYSDIHLPIFSQSAVDGYALCAKTDIPAQSCFELIGEIRAGQVAEMELSAGQAVRIFTGAKIPVGTATVARQEIVQLQHQHICLTENLALHADIRDMGEEIAVGQLLAKTGQQLTVGAIASLSMAGIQQIKVQRFPKIAVLITGDEVADSVADLNSGKIFDANAPMIQAWFQSQNHQVEILHVADTAEAVAACFEQLKNQYDLIISTGGVSVGDYDFVRPVALKIGFEQIFWKVKQKPGKPMLFAQYQREDRSCCLLLGLPGNPAAVYIGLQIYVTALLHVMQGQSQPVVWATGILQHALKADARERFLRMHAVFEDGILKISSLAKQQSHMLSNLMHANCIVRVPAAESIQAGHILQVSFIQH